ncbi:MAG: hypothetical protein QXE31_05000 [Candidatus Woesearchaeota archaeon]
MILKKVSVKDSKDKKNINFFDKLKKFIIPVIVILVLIKLNKTLFFIVFFTLLAFAGKFIRGQFGLKMIVLDPLLFCAIMLAKFIGLKEAIFYVLLNTVIVDFITNLASVGTFLNFFLYTLSAISVAFFGNFDMMIYGNIGSLIYSVLYYFFRTFVLPDEPFSVIMKSITSFVFTFLYLSFIGPLFALIMA